MDLAAFFAQVSDPRRRQGQRFPLPAFLWMTFLALASGRQGPRKMARFCRSNAAFLTTYFDLRHGLPSYGAFRDLLQALDKEALAQAFGRWFTPQVQARDWVAGDGQSLRSTVRDAHGASQSFASVVSLYCQRTGLTLAVQDYTDKKTGELAGLRDLLTGLQDRGVVRTLDALHAQKNGRRYRDQRQRLRAASPGQPAQAAGRHRRPLRCPASAGWGLPRPQRAPQWLPKHLAYGL